MKVKIKKTHLDTQVPKKAYKSDFCYDVVAVSEEEIAPNVWKYGLGIALQIERGQEVMLMYKNPYYVPHQEQYMSIQAPEFRYAIVDASTFLGNIGITLRPRSSIYKTGMVLSNSIGTIDENYTGEISAVFYHVMPNMPRYRVGQKIGQICLSFSLPMDFCEVQYLASTDRGDNGYGSTGK